MTEISKSRFEHNLYIHKLGMQLLQMRLKESKDIKNEKHVLSQNTTRLARLLRKKISVHELDDGGLSVSLDQDWDTTSWPKDMIEAACEALIMIFMTPDYSAIEDRKDRAIVMIQKLLYRHREAEAYLRSWMESMVFKSANRLLRNGRSGCLLDLLHIMHATRDRYTVELAKYAFSGRFHEMLLLESKLAATLIQHTFRAHRKRLTALKPKPLGEDFGTDLEMKMLRVGYATARGFELRMQWRTMHWHQTAESKLQVGGCRGPIHLPCKYTLLGMEIILSLVSEKGLDYASANREDVVRANGLILMAGFLSAPTSAFAELAAQILAHVAKSGESFCTALHSGCVSGCIRFMRHNRQIEEEAMKKKKKVRPNYGDANLTGSSPAAPVPAQDQERRRKSFIDCLQITMRLATHAAGFYRARKRYNYIRPHRADTEQINYLTLVERFGAESDTAFIRKMLGRKDLMNEIVSSLLLIRDLTTVRNILGSLLALSSSDCYLDVLNELAARANLGAIRLVNLIEEQDLVVCINSMCVVLQLCAFQDCRDIFAMRNIQTQLAPLSQSTPNYRRPVYERVVLITAALCRQEEWRVFDPETMPDIFAQVDFVRQAVYLDILRTMKRPPLDVADDLTMADLAVMPVDEIATMEMSKTAEDVGAKALADFFSHPHDDKFFPSLPWEESVSGCVALWGLSMHPGTVNNMFSQGMVWYLGQCIFTARFLFMGPEMSERKLVLILNGVAAAAKAITNICNASVSAAIDDHIDSIVAGFVEMDLPGASVFFINTLCTTHPALDIKMRALQTLVGLSVVKMFDAFSQLLLSLHTAASEALLLQLAPAGEVATRAIKSMPNVYGKAAKTFDILESLCSLLTRLTVPLPGADSAINSWGVLAALRVHMPNPISGMPSQAIDDYPYRQGLGRLSASYFELCGNLCQTDQGREAMLTDGYLRRAMEKLTIIQPLLDSPSVKEELLQRKSLIEQQTKQRRKDLILPPRSIFHREASSCARLISKTANLITPKIGSANDLILNSMFSIVPMCARMLRTQECPRSDPTVEQSIALLSSLALDPVSNTTLQLVAAAAQFEAVDIVNLMKDQLHIFEQLTPVAVKDAVLVLKNIATGLRTEYLAKTLPQTREVLGRVSRLRSNLSELIRDTNWEISKLVRGFESVKKMMAESAEEMEATDYSLANYQLGSTGRHGRHVSTAYGTYVARSPIDGTLPFGDEFTLRGSTTAGAAAAAAAAASSSSWGLQSTSSSPSVSMVGGGLGGPPNEERERQMRVWGTAPSLLEPPAGGLRPNDHADLMRERARVRSQGNGQQGSLTTSSQRQHQNQEKHDLDHHRYHETHNHSSSDGEFVSCGPSNCGSLRFPDHPTSHGTWAGTTDEELRLQMMALPVIQGGELSLSRFAAGDVSGAFLNEMQRRRDKALYSDLKLEMRQINMAAAAADSSSSSSSSSNSKSYGLKTGITNGSSGDDEQLFTDGAEAGAILQKGTGKDSNVVSDGTPFHLPRVPGASATTDLESSEGSVGAAATGLKHASASPVYKSLIRNSSRAKSRGRAVGKALGKGSELSRSMPSLATAPLAVPMVVTLDQLPELSLTRPPTIVRPASKPLHQT